MAKIECELRGSIYEIASDISEAVNRSISATLEEESEFTLGDCRCLVRVYERYSWSGSNRVSLSVTLFGSSDRVWISAVTSGGSQATFFKINTWGEEAFLDSIRDAVEKHRR